MKNQMMIVSIIAIIAVLGIGAYAFLQNSSQTDSMIKTDGESMMRKDETSMDSKDAMMRKDEDTTENDKMMDNKMTASRYIQYSKPTLDNASSNRRVLFFYASWCPTCRPADANFTQNVERLPEDLTLIRVNYNDPETDQEEKELAKEYGITYQHTFVQIDSAGKVVTKWNGGQTDELLSNIK